MPVETVGKSLTETEADAIVVGLWADEALSGAADTADRATGGLLRRLVEAEEISAKPFHTSSIFAPAGLKAPLLLTVGLGKRSEFGPQTAFRAAAAAARHLAGKARGRVAFFLGNEWPATTVEAAVAGALTGCSGQDDFRKEKKRHPIGTIAFAGAPANVLNAAATMGEQVNLARWLVNQPPDDIYPESFAAKVSEVAKEVGLECEVWDEERLTKERCGSLLAVARGSVRPPRLVILRHRGGPKGGQPLVLVGKGVTFDSGGLSLKPSDGMLTMKCDMAGAATVTAAMAAIAQLKVQANVVGLMGLVENMPSGSAMKLGDVLHARSGTTIEVHNTDAEGRLVLADVLDVALQENPAHLVDLATLTGACVVALGQDVAGLMSNDPAWAQAVLAAAETCGEALWQLPMFPEYREHIKSEVADIKNVGDGRWGGAISAAKFLEEFVGGRSWVHLDIAGPAFVEKPKPWTDGGASGIFVRTLVELARRSGK